MNTIRLALCVAGVSMAAVPHKFTAGTPAKADSVNANFEYLDNALKSKADTSALNAVKAQLANSPTVAGKASQGSVDTLKQIVSTKADTSDLSLVKKNISGFATTTSVTDALKLKANQAGLDSVKQANSTQDAKIATLQSGTVDTSKLASKNWANTAFAPVAVSTDVATLKTNTATLTTEVSALKTGKADATAVTTLTATVNGKASSTDLTAIANRTTSLEGSVAKALVLDASNIATVPSTGGLQIGSTTYGVSTRFGDGSESLFELKRGARGFQISQGGRATLTLFEASIAYGTKIYTDLNVAGTISAANVVMQGVPASNVADYVFEPDYKLATLPEIEAFTKANKHLPEVPSAAEIEKGGLDLTQMNLTLLKKVEELTLHAIAQNKQLEAQAAQIQAQNERLQALEASRN